MVVDHGPIKYLISKIRYDEQESPKPNSTYLESFLRQHEENKPRLYLRRIQGLESLHLIHDSGLNPIFKDDLNEKDGVYIYDSEEEPVDEVEKKDEEGDFEIRSFVNINDLETIRKYRNTNFIITGRQVSQRKFRKEKMSLCQRRNKRLQTEVRDADAPYATDVDIALESEIVDESLEDIAIKRYEEIEQQVGRKVKVDTWKGKGVKSICLCNTKKYQVVKGKFGNKSVKVKLTVNRNTRNAAGSKQKMRVCLCNLAKKIIETTAELTTAQNKDALSKTLTGILDTLADDGMSNGENGVTVSPTKLVDPIDVEEIENFSKQKICICKKRKKNVSLKIIRKNSKKSTVMLDAQTEIPDSIEDDQNVFDENDGEKLKLNGDEKLSMVPYEDAIDEYDETYYVQLADKEQDQEKLESNNEVPEHIDGSQNLQVVENKAKGANQDKLDKKSSLKKRARVCLCNRKIKNVAIKITKTMAFGRAVRAGDSSDLKEGQTVEETKLDRYVKAHS
nr:unnamed protein product [Callosobruchus chinensis]